MKKAFQNIVGHDYFYIMYRYVYMYFIKKSKLNSIRIKPLCLLLFEFFTSNFLLLSSQSKLIYY